MQAASAAALIALERLQDNDVETDDLGLAIGFAPRSKFDYPPWDAGQPRSLLDWPLRASFRSRAEAHDGMQTAIGQSAYDAGPASVRKLFGSTRRVVNLAYDVCP